MRVLTWNVNGIRVRQQQVLELLASEQPDVACLQEIKAGADQIPLVLFDIEGYWSYWHGARGYSGVALLVRKAVCADRPGFCHPEFDYEARVATITLGDTTIASVYVPNGGRDYAAKLRFLQEMGNFVAARRLTGGPLVLCGDLNVARSDMDVHPKERKANAIGQRPDEREIFEKVLAHGLTDVGRALDPANDRLFTWWAPWRNLRQRNIGWRLDYVLASEPVATRATACRVLAAFGTSDHAPVIADFKT